MISNVSMSLVEMDLHGLISPEDPLLKSTPHGLPRGCSRQGCCCDLLLRPAPQTLQDGNMATEGGGAQRSARHGDACNGWELYTKIGIFKQRKRGSSSKTGSPQPPGSPHSNNTSKQYDILITRGWMKTLAIRSDFDFKFSGFRVLI